MRRLARPGSILAAALLVTGCRRRTVEPVRAEPAAETASVPSANGPVVSAPSASGVTEAPGARARAVASTNGSDGSCPARRPYTYQEEGPEGRLALPAAFARFTACDVLTAIWPDHDRVTERSAAAKGMVRADQAQAVRWRERDGLVVSFYEGEDAAETMLCGMCRAAAMVAWLVEDSGRLTLVARSHKAIEHGGYGTDSLVIRPTPLAVGAGEELLLLDAHLSGGTSPGLALTYGLRQEGPNLRAIVQWPSGSGGMAGAPDDDRIETRATFTPRPRAGQLSDLVVDWSKAVCPYNDRAEIECKPAVPLGSETLRFDGRTYRRQGAGVKVPFW